MSDRPLGAVHILRNTGWGGRPPEGSPQFITILQRGGLQNLLQHYSFERKMEGYNPFSALNRIKGFHFIPFNADLCLRVLSRIRKKCRKYAFLGGPPRLLRYYIGGVIEIYYNITGGGGGLSGPQICIT